MSKTDIQELLNDYGVSFTDSLSDKLLEIITRERAEVIDELFNKKVFNNNTESLFDLSLKECANDFDDGWNRCYHDFEEIAEMVKEQNNETEA